jgi:hypothetical protein
MYTVSYRKKGESYPRPPHSESWQGMKIHYMSQTSTSTAQGSDLHQDQELQGLQASHRPSAI